jgi:hypothetical protein
MFLGAVLTREKSMKTFALGLIIVLGTFVVACAPVTVQNSQNGPYYALPSWDQQIPSHQRFVVLSNWGNAAVLDSETGLVWETEPRSSPRFFSWYEAFAFGPSFSGCRYSTTGNRRGWRLPSVEELSSLMDPSQPNPGLPPGNPFRGITHVGFWTATTIENDASRAYVVDPVDGSLGGVLKSNTSQRVWCVRGGSNVANPPY